jgi:hypothetical protein
MRFGGVNGKEREETTQHMIRQTRGKGVCPEPLLTLFSNIIFGEMQCGRRRKYTHKATDNRGGLGLLILECL